MKQWAKAAMLAAALLGGTATASHAQAISAYVIAMMDRMRAEVLRRETGAPMSEGSTYFNGELSSLNDDETRTSHLISGWGDGPVTVVGFCDSDCADLDIFVKDENGNEVVADAGVSATPSVTFRPDAQRSYEVTVRMYTCNQAPCFYTIGAFYRM